MLPVLAQFGHADTLAFFASIGVFSKEKRGGYYYPASEQASAVRDALLLELIRLSVPIFYEIGIRSIERTQEGLFLFHTKTGIWSARHCILAAGGKAAKKTGSDGSGILYAEKLGHRVYEFAPALVPLTSPDYSLKEMAGVRAEADLLLKVDGSKTASDRGEVQLTEYGLSGIPTFQISYEAVKALKEQKHVEAELDFLPDFSEDMLLTYLTETKCRFEETEKRGTHILVTAIWNGLLHKKVIAAVLKKAGFGRDLLLSDCGEKEFLQMIRTAKHFMIPIDGYKDFDAAQVCSGGIATEEIDPNTCGSKLVSGLYFAGEIMDIAGICGGYNLQWAWSSGAVAGSHAGRKEA